MKSAITKKEKDFLIDLIEKFYDRLDISSAFFYGREEDEKVRKKVAEIKAKK